MLRKPTAVLHNNLECAKILATTDIKVRSQSSAISFAVVIFLSGQTGVELCVLNKLSQSVRRRLAILRFCKFSSSLLSLSTVFVGCYCRYGLSVTRLSEWIL